MENKDRAKFFNCPKIIGIDPGENGGIAVYSVEDRSIIEVIKMPGSPQELLNFLRIYKKNSTCYLEKVGGLPGMGGASMFKFGKGFGHLEMALISLQIPTIEVAPQKWQKGLSLGVTGKKTHTQWKNKLKSISHP